ncbi:importin subunit alpha-1 [Pelomyxa schiedti]|nr:importin subunit alpha-1 [Pelomyxa schiedti]
MDEEEACGNAPQQQRGEQHRQRQTQQDGAGNATTRSGSGGGDATGSQTTTTVTSGMVALAPTTTVAGAASAANSSDRNVAFTGTVQIRKMLSSPSVVEPPIDEVIKSGVVPRLIQFLSLMIRIFNVKLFGPWQIVFCSGSTEQTEEVIKCGIGPQVIALLSSSPNVNVCEQAAWALGNICGDGIARRDYMIQLGFFPALLKAMIRFPNQMTFLRNATWALSNGCRGKPTPDVSYFQPSPGESVSFMPTLEALLQCNDVDVITDVICINPNGFCQGLVFLSDSLPCVKLIISTGRIIPTLVQILSVNNHNLQIPALRALGDVATQSSEEAQVKKSKNTSSTPSIQSQVSHTGPD